MENNIALRKPFHEAASLVKKKDQKEMKKAKSSGDDDDDACSEDIVHKDSFMAKMMEISSPGFNSSISSSTLKGQDDLLKSAKAEMGEVIEENQKLKMCLDRVMKDYRTLQMQFHDMVQQEPNKSSSTVTTNHQENEEPELVSLCLGRNLNDGKKDDAWKNHGKEKIDHEDDDDKEGLALGLECKFELPKINIARSEHSPMSFQTSSDEVKEEAGETWPPQKNLKTIRNIAEDEASQQNPTKRARVSVRVRCDTPTMNDGCQWRKYGQKIAKGNPCPRAYYRCTVAPNCPVRKQVQRCAEDMSILITTYEGTHSHPLPISATAMASTTSAAASMLLSGSTTSSGSGQPPSVGATFTSSNLNGLNFYLSDNSKPKPFYLPNSSLSSSPSFPTIILDLTTNPSASSHLNKLGNFPPRYSTTNLNFSSLESNSLPISWSNGVPTYATQPYNKNQTNSLSFGRNPQETLYQSYLPKNILNSTQQNLPSELTIAAATKAITSDPSFQSALAAALTSIIGSGTGTSTGVLPNQTSSTDKSALNMQTIESFPVLSSFPSTSNVNKCSSSFLNSKTPSSANSQPGNLKFLSPSLPFSTPNSKATSPGDNRDHFS